MIDDKTIKTNIENQLIWNSSVDTKNIDVEVDDGSVTLTGSVEFLSNKIAAERSVWLVPGVTKINNLIVVKYPEAIKIPDDEEIQTNIENTFLWDSAIFSADVEADVTDGKVKLSGSVDRYWKKLHAETLAFRILGVISVENTITVVPTDKISDKVIAEDIINSIERVGPVEAKDLNIRVEDGEVTVSGNVSNWSIKQSVENIVDYTLGVTDVKNNLIISG